MKITEKQLQVLKEQGKIKGWTNKQEKQSSIGKKSRIPSRSKEKQFIFNELCNFCLVNGIHTLKEEYRFHPERKWRFDWAIVDEKIAIEYEGIFSRKSRHTTISGFSGDVEKYNQATIMGWRVIRLTAKNYLQITELIRDCINQQNLNTK